MGPPRARLAITRSDSAANRPDVTVALLRSRGSLQPQYWLSMSTLFPKVVRHKLSLNDLVMEC